MCCVHLLCAAPCSYKVGYTTKTLQPSTWYLVANNFEPIGGGDMPLIDMIKGLTYTDDPGTAPFVQYWNETSLQTAYFLEYVYDENTGDEWMPGWGDFQAVVDYKAFKPGEACWLRIGGAVEQTANFAGQVGTLTEKEITLTTDWQLVGNPYPIGFQLNGKTGMDCSGLIYTDDPGTAPFIQYWNETGLQTAYFLEYVYDENTGDEWMPGWGDFQAVVDLHAFNPCEGFWARTATGTGTIKFTR